MHDRRGCAGAWKSCSRTEGFPRFSGDKALVEGFMNNGYSAEIARQRIAVGCHWMSLPGMEYTHTDLIKVNLAKVFEVAYDEYRSEKKRTTDGLYRVFLRHLRIAVRCVADGIDFHLTFQHLNAPELMLNLLSHGPIERGLDASNGGLDHYNLCVTLRHRHSADSLGALTSESRSSRCQLGGVRRGLRENFAGRDATHRLMLSTSKSMDAEARKRHWLIASRRISLKWSPPHHAGGRRMIPGVLVANTSIGRAGGATPNGRFACKPSPRRQPRPGLQGRRVYRHGQGHRQGAARLRQYRSVSA